VQFGRGASEVSAGKRHAVSAIIQELLSTAIYKRSQGRITRQVTLAAFAIGVGAGFFRFYEFLQLHAPMSVALGVPFLLTLVCWWVAYRLVNLPRFADFLIAVEAEMNKVSWPTRGELFRSSIVVLVCIVVLAAILAVYDGFWFWLFKWMRIL
jgi:preprotein translocase subunit SecE